MALVLGIDAAWTVKNCSGVALLHCSDRSDEIIAVAPSYEGLTKLADGVEVNWRTKEAVEPDIGRLLECASVLGKAKVGASKIDIVAIDMPMSLAPIIGRRDADQKVSQKFGGRGASVHSPSANRPGRCGEILAEGFIEAGFTLATGAKTSGDGPHLVEVFPLAALVQLMNLQFRPPYKVTKRYSEWRGLAQEKRLDELYSEWRKILTALKFEIPDLKFDLPERSSVSSYRSLKPYEDALDAIICAWVGACFLRGRAGSFGDHDAAIWIPTSSDTRRQL